MMFGFKSFYSQMNKWSRFGFIFFAVGLDVYEEENDKVYEDLSGTILQSSTMARLLSFPNVMVTSHQGFFTREALEAISRITLENAAAFEKGETLENEVTK